MESLQLSIEETRMQSSMCCLTNSFIELHRLQKFIELIFLTCFRFYLNIVGKYYYVFIQYPKIFTKYLLLEELID